MLRGYIHTCASFAILTPNILRTSGRERSVSSTQNLDGLMKWRCIGPFRGGRIVAVAGSYDDPNTFYFGAVAGGIWKTTDAGSYWSQFPTVTSTTSSVGAIAVAPSDSNVIYAGTGETTIRIDVSHGDGVYKSTDAGKSWEHIGLADTRFIGKIRVHPDQSRYRLGGGARPCLRPEQRARRLQERRRRRNLEARHCSSAKRPARSIITVDRQSPHSLRRRSGRPTASSGRSAAAARTADSGGAPTAAKPGQNITANQGLPKGTLGKIGGRRLTGAIGPGLGADRAHDRGRASIAPMITATPGSKV